MNYRYQRVHTTLDSIEITTRLENACTSKSPIAAELGLPFIRAFCKKARQVKKASEQNRHKILMVGAFPQSGHKVFGGISSICKILTDSFFSNEFDLVLVDSTQISNPPPNQFIRTFLAANRFIRYCIGLFKSRPSLVIVFCSGFGSIFEKGLMGWCARALGIPVAIFPRHAGILTTAHTNRFLGKILSCCFHSATLFLCQGKRWQDYAIHELEYSENTAPVIPNWTATENLLDIGRERNYRSSKPVLRILFVGWVEQEKGIDYLLKAIKNLDSHGIDFHLTIAGGGNAEHAAKEFVKTEDLSRKVEFSGWVVERDLYNLYQASDIFILPSLNEGLPNAMIEAMAAGLATIVTSVGNVPNYLTHEKDALLIKTKSTTAIEAAIRALLFDPEGRAIIATNGHKIAKNLFSSDSNIKIFSEIIKDHIQNYGK